MITIGLFFWFMYLLFSVTIFIKAINQAHKRKQQIQTAIHYLKLIDKQLDNSLKEDK